MELYEADAMLNCCGKNVTNIQQIVSHRTLKWLEHWAGMPDDVDRLPKRVLLGRMDGFANCRLA
jgi:hypothetical protein